MSLLKNTPYYQYVKDRLGADILEDETGFIVYSIAGQECFIQEMAVRKNAAGMGYGKALIAELEEIAKKADCKFISANVQLWDKGAANTLTAAFKTGFELSQANNQIITIIKKIGGL